MPKEISKWPRHCARAASQANLKELLGVPAPRPGLLAGGEGRAVGEGLIVDPEILVREPMQNHLTPCAAKGNWRRVRRVKCIGVLNLSYNDLPHIIGLSASC
jgi:hypothetical protein